MASIVAPPLSGSLASCPAVLMMSSSRSSPKTGTRMRAYSTSGSSDMRSAGTSTLRVSESPSRER